MRILGIDPGSLATGYGLVRRDGKQLAAVRYDTLRSRRTDPPETRLAAIYTGLYALVDELRPDVAVIERVFVAASPRTALLLGQARGAALAALGAGGTPVVDYAPGQLKRAVTGYGAASKREVQVMVQHLLGLPDVPPTDAADALALAICHAQGDRVVQLRTRRHGARRGRRGRSAALWRRPQLL